MTMRNDARVTFSWSTNRGKEPVPVTLRTSGDYPELKRMPEGGRTPLGWRERR